jgi:hypothetical protein
MYKLFTIALAALTIALAFFSCSSTSSDSTSGVSIVPGVSGSYQGAGSKWAAQFTTTDFVLKYYATASATVESSTVSGTYVQYSTGFRKLTVTAATSGPSPGDEAYGFEVPGFAFFLKPVGSNEEPIVMLDSGVCPTGGSFNANWIIAKFDPGASMTITRDNFGSAVFDTSLGASSSATITQRNPIDGNIIMNQGMTFDYTTCADSVLSFSPTIGETVDMFFTSNNGALVHSHDVSGTHDSIIFAAPKHTGDITQSELAGTYSALVFDSSIASGDKLFPAKLVIPTSGAATANRIDDVATDTATSDPAISIDNFSAISGTNGLFSAAIDPTGENGRLSCTYFVLNSKNVIACNGFGSASGGHEPFFFLAQERD